MILLKNILIMMVLLSVMLPCSHASGQNDDHGCGAIQGLCDYDGTHCDCHTGNNPPCANNQPVQFKCPSALKIVNAATAVLMGNKLPLPEHRQTINHQNPLISGVPVFIHTVQLLI